MPWTSSNLLYQGWTYCIQQGGGFVSHFAACLKVNIQNLGLAPLQVCKPRRQQRGAAAAERGCARPRHTGHPGGGLRRRRLRCLLHRQVRPLGFIADWLLDLQLLAVL